MKIASLKRWFGQLEGFGGARPDGLGRADVEVRHQEPLTPRCGNVKKSEIERVSGIVNSSDCNKGLLKTFPRPEGISKLDGFAVINSLAHADTMPDP